jgi:hypothetical protein
MPVEDMAAAMADTVADMLRPHISGVDTVTDMPSRMLRADTLVLVFAVGVATVLWAMRAETHALQGAHFTRLAAAGNAAVAGEVVIGIRTTDIPRLAITAGVMAIHITDITVTAPVGTMVHITDIILTDTGTGPTGA